MTTKEQILTCLCEKSGYISGEELSRQLGVSRSAVWKAVKALRAAGYQIDSATNRGYRLAFAPETLSETSILAGLETRSLGRNIFLYDKVDSTNEAAKREAERGAPAGSLFLAEEQTGGKGRLGRAWLSLAGGSLWLSLLLKTSLLPLQVQNLTLLAGLAVCRAINIVAPCNAKIKWPNDVIIGTRKVCGILTELSAEMERVHHVVLGIGINVNISSFPNEISVKATSLQIEHGHEISRLALLHQLLCELEPLLEKYERDTSAFLAEYRPLCATLGRTVSFQRDGKPCQGIAEDLSSAGELLVRGADGSLYCVSSGEVTVQGIYGEI